MLLCWLMTAAFWFYIGCLSLSSLFSPAYISFLSLLLFQWLTPIWQPLNDHSLCREIWILYRGTMSLNLLPSKWTGRKHSIKAGSHWWYFTKIDRIQPRAPFFTELALYIVKTLNWKCSKLLQHIKRDPFKKNW